MAERTLLKGGFVITMDPQLGELSSGDVLIEGDRIVAVGPHVEAADAQVVDVTGDIVIPGFVDTHRHTWETSIRTCAPDYTLGAYFGAILDQFAPKYRPEDVRAANAWGALECINAGITTLVDWSHIMNTPDHADAASEASGHGSAPSSASSQPRSGGGSARLGGSVRLDGEARRIRKIPRQATASSAAGHARHELLQARGRALRVELAKGSASTSPSTCMDRFVHEASSCPARPRPPMQATYIHASH
jgi:cytosine/adenosine deaminase-related metal-dependent hydrolase